MAIVGSDAWMDSVTDFDEPVVVGTFDFAAVFHANASVDNLVARLDSEADGEGLDLVVPVLDSSLVAGEPDAVAA